MLLIFFFHFRFVVESSPKLLCISKIKEFSQCPNKFIDETSMVIKNLLKYLPEVPYRIISEMKVKISPVYEQLIATHFL